MIENIMNTLTTTGLLDLSYRDLALMNATAATTDPQLSRKKYTEILKTDESIKAVTVCFSDIEGRLYMLDYDKKFFQIIVCQIWNGMMHVKTLLITSIKLKRVLSLT